MGYRLNGNKLGVLGGMGPAAAAEFLRLLAVKAPASNDSEHPVVYMVGDTQIPDRSTAILGRGISPQAQIREDLELLVSLGADILAVPCNSAHYFIDRFEQPLPKKLVHIVEETVLAAKKASPQGAWMLSTLGTLQSGLYQKYADKHNFKLYLPNAVQAEKAQSCIHLIKGNEFRQAGERIEALVQELWQVEDLLIMTACTELPLAYAASNLDKKREISSLGALADACVRQLYIR